MIDPTAGIDRGGARPFALREPGIRIAPSLLAADFSRLEQDVAAVEQGGADLLHLDVMDGHFVPNISFGVPVVRCLRRATDLFLDTHLMISDPEKYAEPFIDAGSDHLTFHVEAVSEPQRVAARIRQLGVSVGVAVNPGTPADALDAVLADVDLVLVMSVWPGFGGQAFDETVLSKAAALRGRLRSDQRLEIDGGITTATIGAAAAAGVDTFVAGTAVFRAAARGSLIAELRRLARQAYEELPR